MLTLTEVMEYMKDGYNITDFITVREGNKEYNIDRDIVTGKQIGRAHV